MKNISQSHKQNLSLTDQLLQNKDIISKSVYNIVLATDYTMSFYKKSLYMRYKNLSYSLIKLNDDNIDNMIDEDLIGKHKQLEMDFVTDNFYEGFNLVKELQSTVQDLLPLFVSGIDIRDRLLDISLMLNILSNRKIVSIESVNLIKTAINNVSDMLSQYYNDLSKSNTIDNETDKDKYNIKDNNNLNTYSLELSPLEYSESIIVENSIKDIIKDNIKYPQIIKDNSVIRNIKVNNSKNINTHNDDFIKDMSYIKPNTKSKTSMVKTTDTKIDRDKNIYDNVSEDNIDDNSIDRGLSRKQIILNVLKSGDMMSIKDIADNVPGCSEKTVQRDLNNMLDLGWIKKTGEKRWSKYSANL